MSQGDRSLEGARAMRYIISDVSDNVVDYRLPMYITTEEWSGLVHRCCFCGHSSTWFPARERTTFLLQQLGDRLFVLPHIGGGTSELDACVLVGVNQTEICNFNHL